MRNNGIIGAVPNAGRKKIYGEATEYIGFKVPVSKKEEIKSHFKQYLKRFEK